MERVNGVKGSRLEVGRAVPSAPSDVTKSHKGAHFAGVPPKHRSAAVLGRSNVRMPAGARLKVGRAGDSTPYRAAICVARTLGVPNMDP